MMRTILILLLMAAGAGAQQADELADPYDTPQRPAFQVHEHVQIMVLERAKALSTTDLRTDRRSRWEVSLDEWVQFKSRGGLPKVTAAELAGDPGIDMDSRYRQDNSGRTSRSFDLSFMITAEVVDIRPNGTLVIEARKRRQVNGEVEMIRLTGEVSPSNVSTANVVRSSDIANLDIEYDGEGTTGDQAKPGILGWLLSKLWPF